MKYTLIVLFIITFYSACDSPYSSKSANDDSVKKKLFNFDKNKELDFRTPFFWGYNDQIIKTSFKDSTLFKKYHPLDIGRQAYYSLYYGDKLNDSVLLDIGFEYLNFLKNYKYRIDTGEVTTYAYGFKHREFQKGNWWSGMANSTIAISFYKGYQIFQDSTFLYEYNRVKKSLTLPTFQGGCLVSENGSDWCLEYASFNTNNEDAYYVLNGFLFSMIAIKQLSILSNDEELEKLFNSGKQAFFKLAEKYYYKDNSWTYYMLNPKTIESTHYAIYDMMLFSSLNSIDKDSSWISEIEKRSKIIIKHFPIERISDSLLFFSVLGPPHPYWIDTYPMSIVFNYTNQYKDIINIENTREFNIPIHKRVFHSVKLSDIGELNSVDYYANYSGKSFYIGSVSGESFNDITPDTSYSQFGSFNEYKNVEYLNEDYFIVENDTADLNAHSVHLTLENNDLAKFKYFGFKVKPNFSPRSVRILLIDKNGNSAERYYSPLKPDTSNLVLLHSAGFKRVEGLNLNDLSELRLVLYTSKKESAEVKSFTTSKLYTFPTNYSLKRMFDVEDFYFPEKNANGNIF
ncbi:D-glucuronyl C5-epimerase family protein [Salibacter halophilus]|uniref:D-glucuronyl C5-epimerase C-terminal domain-containing protein n=1 Tax=Salibacter halophilus TaxID=1803916 RepID=A0A6N6MAH8_9FLAO|nr:D-glucuronyl C5-epimerase family protein [Salibacter halophilus]KAB1065710.1 hypothetical protein F3059_03370 [Salibacter halophilus]